MKLRLLLLLLCFCCLLPAASLAGISIDNGNGTMTDTSTGLVWLKNANCTDSSGGITPPYATSYGANYMSWYDAQTWSSGLASGACGLRDGSHAGEWRVPTVDELKSLISGPGTPVWRCSDFNCTNYDYSRAEPASWLTSQGFTAVQADVYWSSSTYPDYPEDAWGVSMDYGNVYNYGKSSGLLCLAGSRRTVG